MRLPAALKWLVLGTGAWLIWRAPIVVDDFRTLRATAIADAAVGNEQMRPSVDRGIKPMPVAQQMAALPPNQPVLSQRPKPPKTGHVLRATVVGDELPSPSLETSPAEPSVAPSMPPTSQSSNSNAGALAQEGYAQLLLGNRRNAAKLLKRAIASSEGDPRADAWEADRHQLLQRWSGDAYAVVRQGGTANAFGTTPSLGGSQMAARLSYAIDPLAERRVSLSGRIYQPLAAKSGRSKAAQAVAAVELQPLPGIPLTAAIERYVAIGNRARDAWSIRMAGGVDGVKVVQDITTSAYAQAGIIGIERKDEYVDGAAKLLKPIVDKGEVKVKSFTGAWAGAQPGASRLDLGAGVEVAGRIGLTNIAGSIDYRLRVAGNAKPGNGVALTVRAGF